jgi:uncharacterized protein YbdZ (MbtH family)
VANQDDAEDTTIYKVVVNHEEQYSIWPADRETPLGWRDAGKSGPKAECLSYIEEVWTDMRPLSLRKHMEEAAKRPAPPEPPSEPPVPTRTGDELVDRLSEGEHPVEASLRPDRTAERLKQSIDRGFVHIKFTGTRGGTELGVRLDRDRSDVSRADFERRTGSVHLEGALTLNYVPVRCIADIDLSTLSGHGRLETVEGSA